MWNIKGKYIVESKIKKSVMPIFCRPVISPCELIFVMFLVQYVLYVNIPSLTGNKLFFFQLY